jgi:DNA end-binding protein Ku
MHALWKGSINFGVVSIPVNLYSASESPGLQLTMLHSKDYSPIRYARICKTEDKEIPYSEIIKGYEVQKNEFVTIEDKDFEKARVASSHSIDIIEFVDQQQIDLRYYDKPYYLEPNKAGEKAYALLREVLKRSKKVAVATFVLHNREHIGILAPLGEVLVLNRIRYAREIRNPDFIKIPTKINLRPEEMQMAATLVKQLTRKFQPQTLHDTYDEDLEKVVIAKSKGKPVKGKPKEAKGIKAKNLMTALRASLKRPVKKSPTRKRKAA